MWPVHGRLDLAVEICGFDVAYNADNLIPGLQTVEFDAPSQWILAGPETARHRFIDDDYPFVPFKDLSLGEIPALQHRNSHGTEEVAVYHSDIDSWSACKVRFWSALERNGHREAGQGQSPVEGQHTDDARLLHSGNSLYPFDSLLEKRSPFLRVLIGLIVGRVFACR